MQPPLSPARLSRRRRLPSMHLTVAKGEAGGGLTNDREIAPGIQHDFYTFLFLHTAHFAIAMLLPQASAATAATPPLLVLHSRLSH